MKNRGIFFCTAGILATSLVWAQSEIESSSALTSEPAQVLQTQAKPSAPKVSPLKASFDSYFFDLQGERPEETGQYEFGDTRLQMQVMSLSYQLNPSWTLMAAATYMDTTVVTRLLQLGIVSRDRTQGLSDTVVSAIHTKVFSPNFLLMTDFGLSLPTGSIDERNKANTSVNYPYNMQLGSGTLDQIVGITPLWLGDGYQVGGRFTALLRTGGFNENGYRLGNQYRTDAWLDVPVGSTGLVPRLVGYYRHREAIRGEDSTLRDDFSRDFLKFYYHSQMNWDVSAALKYTVNFGPTLSFKAEAGVPLAQENINIEDVAIYSEYYGNIGLSGSF